jgi:hypothetical protein
MYIANLEFLINNKMKKIIIIVVLLSVVLATKAQSSEKTYYVTTNLLSPLAGLNKDIAAANALLPLLSNMEYGITLSGGYFKNYHAFETRLTYGKSNDYNIIPQIQLGYNFYILDYFKHNESGLYVGGFARCWLYHNNYTMADLHNVSTNLTVGYTWKKKKIIYDFRINQPLTIYTSSNIENTKSKFEINTSPMPSLLPVLPFLSINIGYKFSKK